MIQADSVYITPPTNTPVDTTRRRFLTVAAVGSMIGAANERASSPPRDVLVDLLGGAEFDHEILNPEAAAKLIIQRLIDAGFEIKPAE
jgi:hypothetical protein